MVHFLTKKTSHTEIRFDKWLDKLKNAHNDLLDRVNSNETKVNEQDERIAHLEERLLASEAEREMTAEKLECIISWMNSAEARADKLDKQIPDITTEVREGS